MLIVHVFEETRMGSIFSILSPLVIVILWCASKNRMSGSSDRGLREIGWQFQFLVLYCAYQVSTIILKGLGIQF